MRTWSRTAMVALVAWVGLASVGGTVQAASRCAELKQKIQQAKQKYNEAVVKANAMARREGEAANAVRTAESKVRNCQNYVDIFGESASDRRAELSACQAKAGKGCQREQASLDDVTRKLETWELKLVAAEQELAAAKERWAAAEADEAAAKAEAKAAGEELNAAVKAAQDAKCFSR